MRAAGPGSSTRSRSVPDSDQRRRHETAILERLAGVAGVAQLAAVAAGPEVIVLEDLGGTPLRPPRRSPARRWSSWRCGWPPVIAAVHRRGRRAQGHQPGQHRADRRRRPPTLIDFELATTFAEERPGFVHQSQIAGTLAYMAPEQTGRTGGAGRPARRPLLARRDLYELATGQPPFGDGDPLRLIHDHLAVVPARRPS
jgi:serine/threonine protein kinase